MASLPSTPSAEPSVASVPGADTASGSKPGHHETDEQVIARLAALKPVEYDRVRRAEAKALGISVKTLDEQVRQLRDKSGDDRPSPWPEVEPHPDPVDLALLLSFISGIIRRFMVMDAEQIYVAAMWVVHTYLTGIFGHSPLLIINAPERECAKTLLQTVLSMMCYRPLPASNASPSALFRAVEAWRPTIFIDEADTFFGDNQELAGLVNAGYASTGFVLRSEVSGDSYEPRMFQVYSAKSIAGIALERHLRDATMSRGIVLNLRRKRADEVVARLRHADDETFELVRAQLTRFAKDAARQIRLIRPRLPDELSDRAQDNWEPLLAIAEYAGPEWLQRATTAALMLSSASEAVGSTGNELLADIREVFERKQGNKISTADLITALIRDEEKPWAAYNRGHPITPRQLSKQLAAYGIKSKTVRLDRHNTPKGYEPSQFVDAFARYLDAPSDLGQQPLDPLDSECDIAARVTDQRSPPDVTAAVPNPDGSSLHADVVAVIGMDDPAPSPDADAAPLDEESVY